MKWEGTSCLFHYRCMLLILAGNFVKQEYGPLCHAQCWLVKIAKGEQAAARDYSWRGGSMIKQE